MTGSNGLENQNQISTPRHTVEPDITVALNDIFDRKLIRSLTDLQIGAVAVPLRAAWGKDKAIQRYKSFTEESSKGEFLIREAHFVRMPWCPVTILNVAFDADIAFAK